MCRKGQDKYDRTDLTVLDRLKGLDHTGHEWTVLNRHTGPDWTRHIGLLWTDRKDIQDWIGPDI